MLRMVDDFVLNKFERLSHWLQRTFGITSTRSARFILCSGALFFIHRAAVGEWADKAIGLYMLLLSAAAIYSSSMVERFGATSDKGYMNEMRESCWKWRVFMLLSFPLCLFRITSMNCGFCCFLAATYFLAVTDLPAAPSRFRQWLDSFSAAPMEAVPNE